MNLKNFFDLALFSLLSVGIQAQKNTVKEADTDYKNESYFEASQKYVKSVSIKGWELSIKYWTDC